MGRGTSFLWRTPSFQGDACCACRIAFDHFRYGSVSGLLPLRAGQVVTVMNDKGQYRQYTLAVKREDIEPLAEAVPLKKSEGKKKIKDRGKVERKK